MITKKFAQLKTITSTTVRRIHLFSFIPSNGKIVRETGLFNLGMVTGLREGKLLNSNQLYSA